MQTENDFCGQIYEMSCKGKSNQKDKLCCLKIFVYC